jgi:hypothetical protein
MSKDPRVDALSKRRPVLKYSAPDGLALLEPRQTSNGPASVELNSPGLRSMHRDIMSFVLDDAEYRASLLLRTPARNASRVGGAESPQDFGFFALLPEELRCLIWKAAMEPRKFHLGISPSQHTPIGCYVEVTVPLGRHPLLPLLRTCQSSRRAVLSKYRWVSAADGWAFRFLFAPGIDTTILHVTFSHFAPPRPARGGASRRLNRRYATRRRPERWLESYEENGGATIETPEMLDVIERLTFRVSRGMFSADYVNVYRAFAFIMPRLKTLRHFAVVLTPGSHLGCLDVADGRLVKRPITTQAVFTRWQNERKTWHHFLVAVFDQAAQMSPPPPSREHEFCIRAASGARDTTSDYKATTTVETSSDGDAPGDGDDSRAEEDLVNSEKHGNERDPGEERTETKGDDCSDAEEDATKEKKKTRGDVVVQFESNLDLAGVPHVCHAQCAVRWWFRCNRSGDIRCFVSEENQVE